MILKRSTRIAACALVWSLLGGSAVDAKDARPNIVIIAEHKKADPDVSLIGITLFTSTVRRPPPDTLDPDEHPE